MKPLKHHERESLIWDADLPTNEKMLLLALNSFVNGDGECYPGLETLAKMTGLTERTCRNVRDRLRAKGIIATFRRSTDQGYRTSDRYKVLFSAIPRLPETASTRSESLPENGAGLPENDDRPTGKWRPSLPETASRDLSSINYPDRTIQKDLSRASVLKSGEARENEPATPTGSGTGTDPAVPLPVQQSEATTLTREHLRPEAPTVPPPPPPHDLFARRGFPQVVPIRAQFEGPWGQGYTPELERFEAWLLEHKAKGKQSPSAWMAAVVDGIAKGGSRALWAEFQQAEVAVATPAKPATDRMAELMARVQAQIDSGVA